MNGPYAVVGRAHSGTSILARLYLLSGIWMGSIEGNSLDAKEFKARSPEVSKLLKHTFAYPGMSEEKKQRHQAAVREIIGRVHAACPDPGEHENFGLKHPILTYCVDILLDALPDAKVVHLVRDGRDVMLSRARARLDRMGSERNKRLVFGEAPALIEGRPLTQELVEEHRNEMEMTYWVTAVNMGLRGRAFPGRYMEVKYEDLCRYPVPAAEKVFEFLGLPLSSAAREWASTGIRQSRMGKWVNDLENLREAMAIGQPLLAQLGYL